ncbi:hypothetical protein [Mucilaginibacter humi]|nr:hypothetical protein [Mucilaginibacter humi]
MAQKMEQEQEEQDEKQVEIDAKQLRELLKSLVNSSFTREKQWRPLEAWRRLIRIM